jgi:tRNA-Thr(GGU) m(6)t(6)A37 methyltransferase TsaA
MGQKGQIHGSIPWIWTGACESEFVFPDEGDGTNRRKNMDIAGGKRTGFALLMVCFFLLVQNGRAETMSETYSIHPVGTVSKTKNRTVLEIFPAYRNALLGLQNFSHAIVLYWFDRNDNPAKRSILQVHPRKDERNPLSGVFATRSPVRPNLIGFSVCRILSIADGNITVEKIDAFDHTPIIDIKPYIPQSDCVPEASNPSWLSKSASP